jgi:hypothetical protein
MSAPGRFCCRSRLEGLCAVPRIFRGRGKAIVSASTAQSNGSAAPERTPSAQPWHFELNATLTAMLAIGGGRATSLASRRKFCAVAASVNSNCAPLGPRRRNRPSRRMRLRCANSISTFLRSRRDCANASVLARARATSRAASFTSRTITSMGSPESVLGSCFPRVAANTSIRTSFIICSISMPGLRICLSAPR